ncbi:ABC transporter ATP-binding protein [Rhizobium sp. BK379]|jgi:ABC-type Fe3+/spermidine/putrescine transport system ATPase subunit|uniref:ABC transporter ATP-binding protein n=1 Tax=Rhizobium sp. BK379 TaxID=2587059 RepID=UPI00161E681C|nr:ABC transporter ATP-binding protein [Rhizobium sp. BK379]MBB3444374.1 ABC-type Fe3+/spermidine/putrescine transport system ATPase subunit [Rhizobium sp. BK379]
MSEFDIELQQVRKSFGQVSVVRDIDLQIPKGEFVSILGPSGCGKTTTLNMIAGFSMPSRGDIRIRGRSQVNVPPEKRNLGLVFQNYALFPHMTVAENVGFGLRMRGVARPEMKAIVESALRSVHLEGFSDRYPRELSGGQQQRVALARAIAPQPSVLLLDEPLSNLDLKLREAMRAELKEIHERLGMTFVYVTHDQEEAMAMSDRIVVMEGGTIAQQGVPGDIYRHPASRFVAEFIGQSNILPVSAYSRSAAGYKLSIEGGPVILAGAGADSPASVGFCSVRPQNVRLVGVDDVPPGMNRLEATLRRVTDFGAHQELEVVIGLGHRLVLQHPPIAAGHALAPGQMVTLAVNPSDVRLLAV